MLALADRDRAIDNRELVPYWQFPGLSELERGAEQPSTNFSPHLFSQCPVINYSVGCPAPAGQQCWSAYWCRLLLWKSFSKDSWSSFLETFSQLLFIKLKGVASAIAYISPPKIHVWNLWRWRTKVNFEVYFEAILWAAHFSIKPRWFLRLTKMSPPSPSVKTSGKHLTSSY